MSDYVDEDCLTMDLHFVTGFPRSGTTLLGAILRQNPRFSAGMSSPLAIALESCRMGLSPATNELALNIDDDQRERVLKAVIDGWLAGYPDTEVFFDCNRAWSSLVPLVDKLRPEAKMIVCVRNPAWVLDSFERLHRKNPLHVSSVFGSVSAQSTVYARAESLMRSDKMVGYTLNASKEAFYSEYSDRMIFIEYDLLAHEPLHVVKMLYDFLGEPWFDHDFENVEYSAPQVDERLDTPGLHTVRRNVQFEARKTVLPPDLFERFSNLAFWRNLDGTQAKVVATAG